jgi:predicted SAM-dependent methyltransferase
MKNRLATVARSVLTSAQREVLRAVWTELRIEFYHRVGLRHVRRRGLLGPKKINLGSGPCRKEGFLNIDLFPGGDLTLDLRRTLPFESACCELIFSEHFFEHIDYSQPIASIVAECLRILKPGGELKFSVPDTEWPLRDYLNGIDAPYFRACRLHGWHPKSCTTRLEHINYHFRQSGQHRFAYDFETAHKLLVHAGFTDVRLRSFDPCLDSTHREVGSLFVAARKPTD